MQKVKLEDVIQFCHENSVLELLGVEIVPTVDNEVRLELFVEEQHTNPYNILHGGVISTMADTAMGAACLLRNRKVVTVSLHMQFIRPVLLDTRIYTDAKILHEGKNIFQCECNLIGTDGKLYAKSGGTFFVISKLIEEED